MNSDTKQFETLRPHGSGAPLLVDDLDLEFNGSFEEAINVAQNNIAEAGGGTVTIHRSLPVEHIADESCPCRPVVVNGVTPRSAESLFAEIEACDG